MRSIWVNPTVNFPSLWAGSDSLMDRAMCQHRGLRGIRDGPATKCMKWHWNLSNPWAEFNFAHGNWLSNRWQIETKRVWVQEGNILVQDDMMHGLLANKKKTLRVLPRKQSTWNQNSHFYIAVSADSSPDSVLRTENVKVEPRRTVMTMTYRCARVRFLNLTLMAPLIRHTEHFVESGPFLTSM